MKLHLPLMYNETFFGTQGLCWGGCILVEIRKLMRMRPAGRTRVRPAHCAVLRLDPVHTQLSGLPDLTRWP